MNGQSLSNPPHMTLVEPAPGWSGIGMGADGKFRIDGSALKAGYKCSTQATLRYGWGLTAKAEKAALLAGTAFHKAADQHLCGYSVDGALMAFDQLYKDWAQVNVAADDKLGCYLGLFYRCTCSLDQPNNLAGCVYVFLGCLHVAICCDSIFVVADASIFECNISIWCFT